MSNATILLTSRQVSGAQVLDFVPSGGMTIAQIYSRLGVDASKFAFKVNGGPAALATVVLPGDEVAETAAKQSSATN